ncbi:DMT family transporter [Plasticicumulans sp.]|uniref:DMT family transporter n=1 Tax=Plasticicumulans sp. TaxID=2307179 RepID=UPI002C4E7B3C|nr:DMT family transporter [Plasticicumulans sp.]MBS0602192.1 DMT family transporter [Pseudomonadota bacterium]HMW28957.1 DMT family transporter [Plasticicumulans sp.]HMX53783.1 DMT family transporter [Plasticicumulans sp.]HMZ09387.1 DMT family transporter [Plasticicumulans sp.]HNB90140.1 DMT family transporter [Plasticicumulans sp.]
MSADHRRRSGLLLVLAAAAGFGLMAVFARSAYAAGVNPPTLLALRFTLAALLLVAIVQARARPWPRGRALIGLIAMGGGFYTLIAQCYFVALTQASAALVALVLYTFPVLVMAINVACFGERLTVAKCGAALLAMAGLALTIGGELHGSAGGIALALVAAAGYAAYILIGDRVARGVDPLCGGAVVIAASAVTSALLALAEGVTLPQTGGGWLAVTGIALVSTVFAMTAFLEGLSRVGSTTAAMASTFEPVVTVASAAWLLGETVSPARLAGGGLILAAVVLLARAPHRP